MRIAVVYAMVMTDISDILSFVGLRAKCQSVIWCTRTCPSTRATRCVCLTLYGVCLVNAVNEMSKNEYPAVNQ